MPTQILAAGTTAADSADVVVAANAELTVCLKDAAGPMVAHDARVLILLKDDAGQYFMVGELNPPDKIMTVLKAGTYRFSRLAGGSCGVFSG